MALAPAMIRAITASPSRGGVTVPAAEIVPGLAAASAAFWAASIWRSSALTSASLGAPGLTDEARAA